ncbi:MAG: ADOP family duplicated permease [Blastocatellia bacterium]
MKFPWNRKQREEDLDAEIRSHLDQAIRDRMERGETEEQARVNALREFGNVGLVKEVTREMWGWASLERLMQDLRFGLRMLRKNPGFSLVAILTLALGIGANTAIFSVVNALLLRPLPYAESERLVLLAEKSRAGERLSASYPNFADWLARAQSFEGMAVAWSRNFTLTGGDTAARVPGYTVNWNFFPLLGVQPQLGRMFTEADDRYGAARTVIVSHGFWQGRLGGEANVIGKTLRVTNETYTVIGVLPPGFEYFGAADVYTLLGLSLAPDSPFASRGSSATAFNAVARLKPGVTVAQANREMDAIGQQLAREYPQVNAGKSAQAERLQDVMSESVRQSLWVLLGAVGFILLIACVNVANLMLVRAAERQKELAVRLALGAGRWRIVRQLLSESLLIAALGGACGLLLGRWMLQGLLALAPAEVPQLSRIGLDSAVLLFTLGIAVLTSLLFGLLPALQASKTDLQTTLKDGGRRTTGASREGVRKALLIAEVGLSLVLLVGAGLLAHSMYNLLHVDPGFKMDNILTMRLSLSGGKYNPQTSRVFYDECLARVSAVPGVRSAALTHSLPIQGSNWDGVFTVADKPVPSRADLPESDRLRVSPNYFETMGMRLLRGRLFTSADTPEFAPVVVINETLARRIWPNENPIGKRIKLGLPEDQDEESKPWREVVGVVNDVKMDGVDRPISMQTYLLFAQEPGESLGLVVRAERNPTALASAVEQAIHAIDKDLPVYSILTMDQRLGNSLAQRRLTLVLLASLATLALLLAAVGIYGVISYAVKQRTHELGIRMALGAQTRDVLTLILAQGLRLTLIGVVLGLLTALALTRWMESLLFGVRPTDALTFGGIALLLTLVALLACWIPARRATKVDPMIALRFE